MKTLLRDLQANVRSFVGSPFYHLMIVSCAAEDSALLLKSFEAVETDPDSDDIYLIFGHPFQDRTSYVRQVWGQLAQQYAETSEELTARGEAALAPLPPESDSETLAPEVRLEHALRHIRSVIPSVRRVVWVFYPLEIVAPREYLRTVEGLNNAVNAGGLGGTKLVARDSDDRQLIQRMGELREVRYYVPALDAESLMGKLNRQANDPRVPPEEQAQTHMMLAGIDVANKNFDRALARNKELLGYYHHAGQKHNQSIVLNNIGDLHYVKELFGEAKHWYEQAVNLSLQLRSTPLLLYQSMNLGNALLMLDNLAEALSYYEAAERLAHVSNAPAYQIQALKRMGEVKYRLRELEEAAGIWNRAVELSRTLQYEPGVRDNLEWLQKVYSETGDSARLQQCERQLAELA